MNDAILSKAVVLAAGAGRRMQRADSAAHLTQAQEDAAHAGHKAMMPVGAGVSRPFLDYILSALADASCHSVCLVIGRDHDFVQRYYEDERPPKRLDVEFARQESPQGTAHALLAAEAFAGNEPFLALNADNLYPVPVLRALVELNGPGLAGFERDALIAESAFPMERIGSFARLEVDAQGRLEAIVEKPGVESMLAAGPHALVSMNLWRFDQRIFSACRKVPRSSRGEFELPEAVGVALSDGVEFRVVRSHGSILDLSSRSDVARIEEQLASHRAEP
jgi:glucose-1-phosphate thymidylyltransferase